MKKRLTCLNLKVFMRLSRKKEKQRKCIFKCDHLYSTYILCHKKIFRVKAFQITVLYINTFKVKE